MLKKYIYPKMNSEPYKINPWDLNAVQIIINFLAKNFTP